MPVIIYPSPLSVSAGGGEDYRQNPAESHQSTEGESVFYGHMVTLMSWLELMAFLLVILEYLPLCFFAL